MTKTLTYTKWLEAAYLEFACCGPEFSLKALARKANLPRATLYYHFDNKEHLINKLLVYHRNQIEVYLEELRNEVKILIPDLYEVMCKYKEGILFHRQLLFHCHVKPFYDLYREANEVSLHILLPFIKATFETDKSDQEIIHFYHTLTDAWYIRLDINNLSVPNMIHLAEEILAHTLGLYSNEGVISK